MIWHLYVHKIYIPKLQWTRSEMVQHTLFNQHQVKCLSQTPSWAELSVTCSCVACDYVNAGTIYILYLGKINPKLYITGVVMLWCCVLQCYNFNERKLDFKKHSFQSDKSEGKLNTPRIIPQEKGGAPQVPQG